MNLAVTAPHGAAAWIAWVAGIAAPVTSIAVAWIALRLSRNESIERQLKRRRDDLDAARRVRVSVRVQESQNTSVRFEMIAAVTNDSDDLIIEPLCFPVLNKGYANGALSQGKLNHEPLTDAVFGAERVGDPYPLKLNANMTYAIAWLCSIRDLNGMDRDFTTNALPNISARTYAEPELGTMLEWHTPGGLKWRRFNLSDPVLLTGHFVPRQFLWRRLVIPDYDTAADCERWGIGGKEQRLGPNVPKLTKIKLEFKWKRDARRKALREARGY